MDLEAFRWLRDAGAPLLDVAARAWADAAGDPVRAATAVRRHEPDHARAAAALTQARLRARAATKMGPDAAAMFFTADGLEQATRPRVAAHRAARLALALGAGLPGGGGGRPRVVDLGCGIGGDLVALARAGVEATGVDLDPLRVEVARANLAALGLTGTVELGDATAVDLSAHDAAYADPARRSARGRELDASGWTPPWPFVEELLAPARRAVVKVAPGLPHAMVPPGVEAEWVSAGGEVKEAALWSPPLATVRRRATVIPAAGPGLATLTDEDDPWGGDASAPDRPVASLGRWLYEPDGAVIRAGLVTAVADRVGGGLLDPHIAWVTAEEHHRTPFARGYEVLERLPFREKQLRAALRERGIGRLEIKKRGVDVVPERLRPRLALSGDAGGTLVLTREAGHGVALLVRPDRPDRSG